MHHHPRPNSPTAFTLIELLVVISIIALLIGILLPSLGSAKLSAKKTICMANSRTITQASLAYESDHRRLPPDFRSGNVNAAPTTLEQRDLSWFGQLDDGEYILEEPEAFDCPVIDDHRKVPQTLDDLPDGQLERVWYTDYVMNRYAINQKTATAEEPARCPMIMEPNMARGCVAYFEETIGSTNWWTSGGRTDLEQRKANSLSFSFVDGHVSRVPIDHDQPYPRGTQMAVVYPDIFIPSLMGRPASTTSGQKFFWKTITLSDRDYVLNGPPTH